MLFKNGNKVKVNNTQITTYVGVDTKIEGTVITKTSLRVDGSIVGGVCADGTVVVSKSGYIKGNVIAQNIVVAGKVDGNLQIKDKTNIEPTGTVIGDISTSRILIDEESTFQGNCNMKRSEKAELEEVEELNETRKPEPAAEEPEKKTPVRRKNGRSKIKESDKG